MSRKTQCFLVVFFLHIVFMLIGSATSQPQLESIENSTAQNSDNNKSSSNYNNNKPWETPLEELQRITGKCAKKVSGIAQIAHDAMVDWINCMGTFNTKFLTPESSDEINGNISTTNGSADADSFTISAMPICANTTAFKSCWLSVISALNECEDGIGDVAASIYFALYDDACRDGGRLTIENRRKVVEEGEPCPRNYSSRECAKYMVLHRNLNDLCLRFNSITSCDLSSIDPKCLNQVDKQLHANIFERVRLQLQCTRSSPSKSIERIYLKTLYIVAILVTAIAFAILIITIRNFF
ncbi:unnamed protein product [Orchesella dallaii]|uniref:Uncharacterized protein n=1 Tax=Orchesella dallaii TaxID=48710 RepID=A0ABP1PNW0_9HEXA